MLISDVPLTDNSIYIIAKNKSVMYRKIIAVCSEIYTKHINTLCEQNVELLNVSEGETCINQWPFKG
jgi:hypothetical protein